ncbi:helix-turn-helix transcriptional regulator [Streptomyces sp. APSN-46.1]|uniref:helix-turn-helix domain-containing protein n=1 Tax=Streptomyces sp. APSN-46.1 TaxID=2929049 RepID=UPI001FB2F94B|nr:helix-turn-helix domain-containing protein [Streptomyces sp. APSN-46.1]MCJ1680133.1 helix-turn-helix transcriptional regulator [Streptomyces sp. APSN-46.1]
MLGAIGLDEGQESAYRALVALGAAEVPDLAHRLTLPVPQTERALRHLERQGLAARSSARPGRWVAAPPGVALDALLTRQRNELEQAELAAALLAQEYRAEASEPAVHDLVEVVTGASAVAHRFHQLQLGAVEEVCALVTGGPQVVTGLENEADERASVVRGVAYRVVIEREVLALPTGIREAGTALARGERIRVTGQVPTKLVIADRSLALVPLTTRGAEPTALVVHASGLLESLMGLFEAVWRESLPLRLGSTGSAEESGGGPDATDLEILTLLLAGMTDASVAKHLELGLRTVQRRVKGLMELAGVTTRLQLGWHAYERGWVAR